MAIRLLALDIDGTLLNSRHELTPATEKALLAAQAQGIHIVLATGKQYVGVMWLVERLKLTDPQITSHGALITDPVSGDPIFQRGIPADLAAKVIDMARDLGVTMIINGGGMTFAREMNRDVEYMLSYGDPVPAILPDLKEVLNSQPTHLTMIAYQNDALYESAEKAFRAALDSEVAINRSSPYYLEFSHPEANKGSALKKVCEILNVNPVDALAIGDSFNDLSMFAVAGQSVAMGHASEGVKSRATRVTGTNNEDGVARVVEELLQNRL